MAPGVAAPMAEITAPVPPAPAPAPVVRAPAVPAKKSAHAVKPSAPVRTYAHGSDPRAVFAEAKSLLVPRQKYLLKFEDEQSHAFPSEQLAPLTTSFSEDEVEQFRRSVQFIADYDLSVRNQCQGQSARSLTQSLEKYAEALNAFNRRALPLVGDISENNNLMVLLINRTTLKDAPVLISRFMQFKKQRFKESLDQFVGTDGELIASMVQIAKALKTDISSDDWNRGYAVRENAVELVSMWPRRMIFEASSRLNEPRENTCIAKMPSKTPVVAE